MDIKTLSDKSWMKLIYEYGHFAAMCHIYGRKRLEKKYSPKVKALLKKST